MRILKSMFLTTALVLGILSLGPIQKAQADYPEYHDAGTCRRNWGCWFQGATMDGYIAHCYSEGELDPATGALACVCNPELYGDVYPCAWQIWE